jgi:hypothetical protein
MSTRLGAPVALIVAAAACASTTPGAAPHDMSAASHQEKSEEHAAVAEQHQQQYVPGATVEVERCAAHAKSRLVAEAEGICWTSTRNPTSEHLEAAEAHRRQAADHRAASAALREAEASACAGIAPSDRDTSPFQHPDDIARVEPFRPNQYDVRAGPRRETIGGAVVSFRAVPGLDVDSLQRVVNCHLARNAALGHVVPEMADCPLVPRDVEAHVSATDHGLDVTISSSEPESAREVLERAKRLMAGSTSGQGSPR